MRSTKSGLSTSILALGLSSFLLFSACNAEDEKKKAQEEAKKLEKPVEPPTRVKTFVLEEAPFDLELIANGKLVAPHRSDLKFRTEGIIEKVLVVEGQRVSAGQLIAQLNDADQQIALRKAQLNYQKARLEFEDYLLKNGYKLSDSLQLDAKVLEIAKLRSGLSNAEFEMADAHKNIQSTRLVAPYAGKIANLKAKAHNSSSAFEYICTLVDDREFNVEFKVLEQELPFIQGSRTVRIEPFSNAQSINGQVVGVNPLVEEGGMIQVKARIANTGQLIEGMAVRVMAQNRVDKQLSVPREAVVDRQGRKVVFTFKDGIARWNYVKILYENSTHIAVSEGLKVGDEVIFDGNYNLAHDKPVVKQ